MVYSILYTEKPLKTVGHKYFVHYSERVHFFNSLRVKSTWKKYVLDYIKL